jgi:hypothetical protein
MCYDHVHGWSTQAGGSVTAPRILVREDAKNKARGTADPAPELGWYLLGGLGLVFAMVGGLDLLLAWYPTSFGSPEWKFATVTATMMSFPLFSLGLALLAGSAMGRGKKGMTRTMAIVLLVVAVLVLGCAMLYLPQISTALASVKDPTVLIGVKRAVMKTVVQLVMYPVVLMWIAWLAWKQYRSTT